MGCYALTQPPLTPTCGFVDMVGLAPHMSISFELVSGNCIVVVYQCIWHIHTESNSRVKSPSGFSTAVHSRPVEFWVGLATSNYHVSNAITLSSKRAEVVRVKMSLSKSKAMVLNWFLWSNHSCLILVVYLQWKWLPTKSLCMRAFWKKGRPYSLLLGSWSDIYCANLSCADSSHRAYM